MKLEPFTTTADTRRSFEEHVDRLADESTFTCPRNGEGGPLDGPDDGGSTRGLPTIQDARERLERMLGLEASPRIGSKAREKVHRAETGRTTPNEKKDTPAAKFGVQGDFAGKLRQPINRVLCADSKVSVSIMML